jgi:cupin fold WbuC family metalloprotein
LIKTIKESNDVLYPKEDIVTVSELDLDELKQMAKRNPRNRIRLCTHNNFKDLLHEMIIYHPKDTYVPPHKHLNKDESFHLISGEIDCVIFDNKGIVEKTFFMSKFSGVKTFYYRIPSGTFHTQIFKEDTFFHEVTKGPFNRKDTVIANWAPREKDEELVMEFMKNLKINVNNYKD